MPFLGTLGAGSFNSFRAISKVRNLVSLIISANTTGYDVYTNRGPSYIAGISDIVVTINPSVEVTSTSSSAYAMLVPSAFEPGDAVTIINNGRILGAGGAAGAGGDATASAPPGQPRGIAEAFPGTNGNNGGSALYVNRPVTVENNNEISGGGGGGGGGGGTSWIAYSTPKQPPSPGPTRYASGGGGGGGRGPVGGAGANAGVVRTPGPLRSPTPAAFTANGSSGTAGSVSAAGIGGSGGIGPPAAPATEYGGNGGNGGGIGASGSSGGSGAYSSDQGSFSIGSGGSGGAAGNYIVGNPFVTWRTNGTRQGGVA